MLLMACASALLLSFPPSPSLPPPPSQRADSTFVHPSCLERSTSGFHSASSSSKAGLRHTQEHQSGSTAPVPPPLARVRSSLGERSSSPPPPNKVYRNELTSYFNFSLACPFPSSPGQVASDQNSALQLPLVRYIFDGVKLSISPTLTLVIASYRVFSAVAPPNDKQVGQPRRRAHAIAEWRGSLVGPRCESRPAPFTE